MYQTNNYFGWGFLTIKRQPDKMYDKANIITTDWETKNLTRQLLAFGGDEEDEGQRQEWDKLEIRILRQKVELKKVWEFKI